MHRRLQQRTMCQEGNMITSAIVAHNVRAETLSLGALLQLVKRARQATSLAELCFIAVNETFQLTPYRQAVLWLQGEGVVALSGVTTAEEYAPYVLWLNALLKRLASDVLTAQAPQPIEPNMLTAEETAAWNEWLPACGIWLPLPGAQGRSEGGLLLMEDRPWSPPEMALLTEWIAIFAHARASVAGGRWINRLFRFPTRTTTPRTKAWRWPFAFLHRLSLRMGGAVLPVFSCLPVSLTVLAPA